MTDQIIKDIRENLETLTPQQIDEYRIQLSAWYDTYSSEMAIIEQEYAETWLELRKGSKTDKMAEMMYDTTQAGKRRIKLKFKLRSLEKLISSLSARMRRLNNEVYNKY